MPSRSNEATNLYLQLAEQHGHYCPMSTLGLRLGLEAVRLLTGTGWRFCYYAQTCAVDGILLALKQSRMADDLQVARQGQHLLRCHSKDGRELSLSLTTEALRMAKQYPLLSQEKQPQHLELLRSVAVEQIFHCAGVAS